MNNERKEQIRIVLPNENDDNEWQIIDDRGQPHSYITVGKGYVQLSLAVVGLGLSIINPKAKGE